MKRNDSLPAQAMEALEAQVRDAFGAAADTITAADLPPRPVPARNSRASRSVWSLRAWAPRARVRALVPVAAAASVTAIAVTAAVVSGLLDGTPSGNLANPASAPPFFAAVTADRTATGTSPVTAVKIYHSGSGRPVPGVKLTVPASQRIQSVSRLGNDRTFVVAAFERKTCVTHLTRFSVSAAGQIQRIAPLSVPRISGDAGQLVSSADGKVLASFMVGCGPPGLQVVAIHLATGQISRWRDPSGTGGSPSLTADGSVLGFASQGIPERRKLTAWTIRTDAPAGSLFTSARQVLDLPGDVAGAVLSPSGAQLYAENWPDSGRDPVVLSLYRTSTGSLIRQVARLKPGGKHQSLPLLTLDQSGRHMLAFGFYDDRLVKAIDLRTGRHFSLSLPHLAFLVNFNTVAW